MWDRCIQFTLLGVLLSMSQPAVAQLTPARPVSTGGQKISSLEDQLINGLRATRYEQQEFVKTVVVLSKQSKLDERLINAVYIWSRRRQPLYPFPYFARAMRIEAQKRGVMLPQVAMINRGGIHSPPPGLAN